MHQQSYDSNAFEYCVSSNDSPKTHQLTCDWFAYTRYYTALHAHIITHVRSSVIRTRADPHLLRGELIGPRSIKISLNLQSVFVCYCVPVRLRVKDLRRNYISYFGGKYKAHKNRCYLLARASLENNTIHIVCDVKTRHIHLVGVSRSFCPWAVSNYYTHTHTHIQPL